MYSAILRSDINIRALANKIDGCVHMYNLLHIVEPAYDISNLVRNMNYAKNRSLMDTIHISVINSVYNQLPANFNHAATA